MRNRDRGSGTCYQWSQMWFQSWFRTRPATQRLNIRDPSLALPLVGETMTRKGALSRLYLVVVTNCRSSAFIELNPAHPGRIRTASRSRCLYSEDTQKVDGRDGAALQRSRSVASWLTHSRNVQDPFRPERSSTAPIVINALVRVIFHDEPADAAVADVIHKREGRREWRLGKDERRLIDSRVRFVAANVAELRFMLAAAVSR